MTGKMMGMVRMIIAIASIRQPSSRYISMMSASTPYFPKPKRGEELGHLLRRLRDGKEVAEQQRADQHGEHGSRGAGRLQQRRQYAVLVRAARSARR